MRLDTDKCFQRKSKHKSEKKLCCDLAGCSSKEYETSIIKFDSSLQFVHGL